MPKRRTIPSLQRLCLKKVATNMEHAWATDDRGNYLEGHRVSFRELAGSLVSELLQLMEETLGLSRAKLRFLLVPHLTELNLSTCPELISKDILQIITVRCKNLSSLDLQNSRKIPAQALADLVRSLPRLKKLNLSKTQCNTQVLSAVGSCCRRIRELDISGCKRLTPDSLLHLAYDLNTRSLCCSGLQKITMHESMPETQGQELIGALAFVLLALPSLKAVLHKTIPEAVCLILHQRFDDALIFPPFPFLGELAQSRMSTDINEESPRLTLPLKEIYMIIESSLAMVCAICPHLETLTVLMTGSSALDQTFLSCHHLTHLTIRGSRNRGLRELLPVMMSLRAQLQSLSFSGFRFEDELSFHTLLSHCLNLQTFAASLGPPLRHNCSRHPDVEALGWVVGLATYKFPQLCDFLLEASSMDDPVFSQHAAALRASLVSLLKHSPCLETVELVGLPFSLDEVFEEVLEPSGNALVHLCNLSLVQDKVSIHSIHRLLSSDNQLSFLAIERCPNLQRMGYDEVLQRINREGFELNIVWN